MTTTKTADVEGTLQQIYALAAAGCDIVRCTCNEAEAAEGLAQIVPRSPLPVIADIHHQHKMALAAMEAGVQGLRLNPGNIRRPEHIKAVAAEAKDRGLSIRIGVNGGSLDPALYDKYGGLAPEAMVESALRHLEMLEKEGFYHTKISLKASDVVRTVAAYRLLAKQVDYPFHLGVTEAGTPFGGTIRSSIGMGILLGEGIGDTIRVSLTGDGEEECRVGHEMLRALALREGGIRMVSCPSCGRVQIDLNRVANEIEAGLKAINHEGITYAVMGCVVNGPGEAKDADLGVAGGAGEGLIYRKGELIRKVKEEDLVPAFLEEARKYKQELETAGA